MASKEELHPLLFEAVDELNEQLGDEGNLTHDLDAKLIGEGGRLDSLGLVNLIVAVEQRVQDQYDVALTLADERAFSQKHSPFRTLGALAEYVHQLLAEQTGG